MESMEQRGFSQSPNVYKCLQLFFGVVENCGICLVDFGGVQFSFWLPKGTADRTRKPSIPQRDARYEGRRMSRWVNFAVQQQRSRLV